MMNITALREAESRSISRVVAWMALSSAGLLFIGRLMAYVGIEDSSDKLTEAGAPMSVLFVGGGVVVLIATVAGLMGARKSSWFAAGVVSALVGPTVWIIASASKFVVEYNRDDWGDKAGLRVGALVHVLAVLLAIATCFVATSNDVAWEEPSPATPPSARVWLAAAFIAVPVAVLFEHDDWSVWDIDSGLVQFAALIWALGPAGVAAWLALRGRVQGIILAIGVATGNLIAAIGMRQDQVYNDGYDTVREKATYLVPGSGILLWGSIIAGAIGLLCLSQMGVVPALNGTATGTAPAPSLAPPPPSAPPAAATPPRWAPDPFGRFEYRFFDGVSWTASVSTGGVVSADPPVPAPPT